MRKKGKLYYRRSYERKMHMNYPDTDACRLALGLVKPYSRVLSAGCGAGREVKFLTELGCNVTAIDINKNYINQSKKFAPSAKYILGDMTTHKFFMPFEYILCLCNTINAIYKPHNRLKFVETCADNLISGGKLILTTKSFWRGFLNLNDYTLASLEIDKWFSKSKYNWEVEKIKVDGIWLIVATKS